MPTFLAQDKWAKTEPYTWSNPKAGLTYLAQKTMNFAKRLDLTSISGTRAGSVPKYKVQPEDHCVYVLYSMLTRLVHWTNHGPVF